MTPLHFRCCLNYHFCHLLHFLSWWKSWYCNITFAITNSYFFRKNIILNSVSTSPLHEQTWTAERSHSQPRSGLQFSFDTVTSVIKEADLFGLASARLWYVQVKVCKVVSWKSCWLFLHSESYIIWYLLLILSEDIFLN